MKIIQENIPIITELIGNQNIDSDIELRSIVYSIEIPIDNGVLLYNTLTKCMVFILETEKKDVLIKDFLKHNWFLVPNDFDDKKFASQIKGLAKLFNKSKNGFSTYTIFTTMECNARCFYCYEKHREKKPMSDETIDSVVDYIVNTHTDGKIWLHWFGGEPLYNVKVIDKICDKLIHHNIEFSSFLVSNGYLFDDEMVDRAKKIWKLDNVQITLDGTESVYNRSKSFIYKGINAYQRVLENIGKLINREIRVQVRLNVSVKNADDLVLLLDELKNKFGTNKYLVVYCHSLFEKIDSEFIMPVVKQRKQLLNKQRMVRDKISDLGYNFKNISIPSILRLYSCKADNPNSIMILPDGSLGKCEHYTDNHFVGHINNTNYNESELNKFNEKIDDIDACNTCSYYPDCQKLKLCETDNYCYPEFQTNKIEDIKIRMLNTYNSYLKKQQITEDENDEIEIQC